ncbi:25836_t:CDS:1, partial [Gigaspora margarita]
QHIQAFNQVNIQANPQPIQVFASSQLTNLYSTLVNLFNKEEFLLIVLELKCQIPIALNTL